MSITISKVISGGQTGVDRGALDAAIDAGVPHGGYCPVGRRAEDGRIPDRYRLRELGRGYPPRTRRNVEESSAVLILSPTPLTGGTALTERIALGMGRPCLVVDAGELDGAAERVAMWLSGEGLVLMVAGPRASRWPSGHRATYELVSRLLVLVGRAPGQLSLI